MEYVAGFMFSSDLRKLLLIRKKKPATQCGLLNAIGGKIERGEHPEEAMIREFREETGVLFAQGTWDLFCELKGSTDSGKPFKVYFYRVRSAIGQATQQEEEELEIIDPLDIPEKVMYNLHWLIPMAMSNVRLALVGEKGNPKPWEW